MIANFFTRISYIKDQLSSIGDLVVYSELVNTMVNCFPPSWDPFFQGIYGRNKLPKFDKLWANFSQKESIFISKKQKLDDEENQELATQVNNIKEREEGIPRRSNKPRRKRDILKIQLFNCRNMRQYATQCPHKHEKEEKKKHHAHETDVEGHKLKDEYFLFISTLTITITQGFNMWLIY